jgi:hypothetical protein
MLYEKKLSHRIISCSILGQLLKAISSLVVNGLILFGANQWMWLVLIIVLNTIPIGNEANQSLSDNRIITFRLYYLLHSIMILGLGGSG